MIKRTGRRLTTGYFLAPFQPAAVEPVLKVYLTNTGKEREAVTITLYALQNGVRANKFRTTLDVPAGQTNVAKLSLYELEGLPIEVDLAIRGTHIEPSAALLQVFTSDGTEELMLYIPSQEFAEISDVRDSRKMVTLTSGAFPVPNIPQIPSLRVYFGNYLKKAEKVRLTILQVGEGENTLILRRTVEVPSESVTFVEQDLSELRGLNLNVFIELPSRGVLPSLELGRVFQADAANETLLWLSPKGFTKLSEAEGELTRIPMNAREPVKLDQKRADVTGDGKTDTVTLYGNLDPTMPDMYYVKMFVRVRFSSSRKYINIKLPESAAYGYQPSLWLGDLTGNGIADVYVVSRTGGTGNFVTYAAYSVTRGVPKLILSPDVVSGVVAQGKFVDGYKALMRIPETGKCYLIDLSDRKDDYDEAGVYKDGKLLMSVELTSPPFIALDPTEIGNGGRYDLVGAQAVKGLNNSDNVAKITTKWHWYMGKWRLVDSVVERVGYDGVPDGVIDPSPQGCPN